MNDDINCLSYWFPPLEAAGLPVPRTTILTGPPNFYEWLDGQPVKGGENFLRSLQAAVVDHQGGPGNDEVPVFLRTGHTSGKHDWNSTCHLTKLRDLEYMVGRLVEQSAMADMMGLPTDVWAVRDMIPTRPLFVCEAWNDFPVTREFRLFVRDGKVTHLQPYWPFEAIEGAGASDPNWFKTLEEAAYLRDHEEYAVLVRLAERAHDAILRYTGRSGYWSVDCLQDRSGRWWVTDMADGDRSFKWGIETPA